MKGPISEKHKVKHKSKSADLGDNVDRANDILSLQARRGPLFKAALLMGLSLLTLYLTTPFVIERIMDSYPDRNTEKRFFSFDNPYPDIIEATIPNVQEWYRSFRKGGTDLIPLVESSPDLAETSCTQAVRDWIFEQVPMTSPSYIEWILDDMGLSSTNSIRRYMQPYMKREMPLEVALNKSNKYNITATQCLYQIQGLSQIMCGFEQQFVSWDGKTNIENLYYLRYSVNLAVVLQVLTASLRNDMSALNNFANFMTKSRYHDFSAERISRLGDESDVVEFGMVKYEGVAFLLLKASRMIASKQNALSMATGLQVNILEAVKEALRLELETNARVGMALAAAVQFDLAINDDYTVTWPLGRDWLHSYMTWNLVFVTKAVPLYSIAKLVIPEVTCSTLERQGDDWILGRTLSLALSLTLIPKSPRKDLGISGKEAEGILQRVNAEWDHRPVPRPNSTRLAEVNLRNHAIDSPPPDTVEEMLYDACGEFCYGPSWGMTDSIVHAHMTEQSFNIYLGFIFWLVVVSSGLGLEILFWATFLSSARWSEAMQKRWIWAQCTFSLLVAAAVGLATSHNFLGIIVLTVSVWKFGFPETWTYVVLGLWDFELSRAHRAANIFEWAGSRFPSRCNGFGCVHGANECHCPRKGLF